jgi:hypothetical protein
MKRILKVVLLYTGLVAFYDGIAFSQLYSPDRDVAKTVKSQLTKGLFKTRDSLFVYYATDIKGNLYTQRGTLKAIAPDNTTGWTFIWSRYDRNQRKFIKTDSVVLSGSYLDIKSNLNTGGYQVEMKKGILDTVFRAWIFIDQLRLHLRKTSDSAVSPFYSHCSYIQLGVIKKNEPASDTSKSYIHNDFYYADSVPGRRDIPFKLHDSTIVWTAEKYSGYLDKKLQIYVYDPPMEQDVFTISFSDTFGNTASDLVKYKDPIRTKADFKFSTFKPAIYDSLEHIDTHEDSLKAYTNPDSLRDEAPLNVQFVNRSKNVSSFEWYLVDTFHRDNNVIKKQADHIIRTDINDSVVYFTYYRPIDVVSIPYNVKLFSYGPRGVCIDSAIKRVVVHSSQLHSDVSSSKDSVLIFPTAFTPGIKPFDYFTYKEFKDSTSQVNFFSIRSLHLSVFSQWGKLVYEYNGPVLYGWKGWDGKTKFGGNAPPGIYFYRYEALGWGPISRPTGSRLGDFTAHGNGFVYLVK